MPIPTSEIELAVLFEQMGARDPSSCASSQISGNNPQLMRYWFLKSAWDYVPREGESQWIDREVQQAQARPNEPYAGLGAGLKVCLDKGVTHEQLNEMARCLQAQMLFHIAYLLDGPTDTPEGLEDISWGLFQTNEDGEQPTEQIYGLHESVLETDPTGREMRPRSV